MATFYYSPAGGGSPQRPPHPSAGAQNPQMVHAEWMRGQERAPASPYAHPLAPVAYRPVAGYDVYGRPAVAATGSPQRSAWASPAMYPPVGSPVMYAMPPGTRPIAVRGAEYGSPVRMYAVDPRTAHAPPVPMMLQRDPQAYAMAPLGMDMRAPVHASPRMVAMDHPAPAYAPLQTHHDSRAEPVRRQSDGQMYRSGMDALAALADAAGGVNADDDNEINVVDGSPSPTPVANGDAGGHADTVSSVEHADTDESSAIVSVSEPLDVRPAGKGAGHGRGSHGGSGRGRGRGRVAAPAVPKQRVMPDRTDPLDGLSPEIVACHRLLEDLMSKQYHSIAFPFLQPVDVKGLGLTNYHEIVERPMDLSTLKRKLAENAYTSITDFVTDLRLIFYNCYRYNGPTHDVSKLGQRLEAIVEQKLALLPRSLREKTALSVTTPREYSSGLGADDGKSGRRRARAAPQSILKALEEDMANIEREQKRRKAEEQRLQQLELMTAVAQWESLHLDRKKVEALNESYDFCSAALMLSGYYERLHLPYFSFEELELAVLFPYESAYAARVHLALLRPTREEMKKIGDVSVEIPFEYWDSKLRARFTRWHTLYTASLAAMTAAPSGRTRGVDSDESDAPTPPPVVVSEVFPFEYADIFEAVNGENVLQNRRFCDLPVALRARVLRLLCECVVDDYPFMAADVANIEELRATELGRDADGNEYFFFRQFIESESRIYRQLAKPPQRPKPASAAPKTPKTPKTPKESKSSAKRKRDDDGTASGGEASGKKSKRASLATPGERSSARLRGVEMPDVPLAAPKLPVPRRASKKVETAETASADTSDDDETPARTLRPRGNADGEAAEGRTPKSARKADKKKSEKGDDADMEDVSSVRRRSTRSSSDAAAHSAKSSEKKGKSRREDTEKEEEAGVEVEGQRALRGRTVGGTSPSKAPKRGAARSSDSEPEEEPPRRELRRRSDAGVRQPLSVKGSAMKSRAASRATPDSARGKKGAASTAVSRSPATAGAKHVSDVDSDEGTPMARRSTRSRTVEESPHVPTSANKRARQDHTITVEDAIVVEEPVRRTRSKAAEEPLAAVELPPSRRRRSLRESEAEPEAVPSVKKKARVTVEHAIPSPRTGRRRAGTHEETGTPVENASKPADSRDERDGVFDVDMTSAEAKSATAADVATKDDDAPPTAVVGPAETEGPVPMEVEAAGEAPAEVPETTAPVVDVAPPTADAESSSVPHAPSELQAATESASSSGPVDAPIVASVDGKADKSELAPVHVAATATSPYAPDERLEEIFKPYEGFGIVCWDAAEARALVDSLKASSTGAVRRKHVEHLIASIEDVIPEMEEASGRAEKERFRVKLSLMKEFAAAHARFVALRDAAAASVSVKEESAKAEPVDPTPKDEVPTVAAAGEASGEQASS